MGAAMAGSGSVVTGWGRAGGMVTEPLTMVTEPLTMSKKTLTPMFCSTARAVSMASPQSKFCLRLKLFRPLRGGQKIRSHTRDAAIFVTRKVSGSIE